MHDGGEVVHRDKRISRGMAGLLMIPGVFNLVLAAFIAVVNDTASKPLPAAALPLVVAAIAALGLMFIGLGIVFAVVRTIVTEHAVHVKYGLWGPRIPLESIRSCKVVDYHWTELGGWGIRLGKNGTWAYVPGGKRVVELLYVEGRTEKRVLVGVGDPDETALQINRARRLRGGESAAREDVAAGEVEVQEGQRVAGGVGNEKGRARIAAQASAGEGEELAEGESEVDPPVGAGPSKGSSRM